MSQHSERELKIQDRQLDSRGQQGIHASNLGSHALETYHRVTWVEVASSCMLVTRRTCLKKLQVRRSLLAMLFLAGTSAEIRTTGSLQRTTGTFG